MKTRCCNCGFVFAGGQACKKCGSDSTEILVKRSQAGKHESRGSRLPQLLVEVPDQKSNLME